jgi:lipopolysaccharide/colanic/teichoic acid biosynthesis glycosyltransferase
MSAGSWKSARWFGLLDLLACFAGFALALWVYGELVGWDRPPGWADDWARDLAVSALVAWIAIVFPGGGWRGGMRNWFDLSFCAVGFNLVVQYGLKYLSLLEPTPWLAVVAGGVASVGLIGGLRAALGAWGGGASRILLVGCDPVAQALAVPLRSRVSGVLARDPSRSAAGLPVLGDLSRFDEVVAALRPDCVVFTEPDWLTSMSPRRLLRLHYSGVAVEDGATVFEDVLQRVCWQRLRPVDMLLTAPATGSHAVQTLQAVYTNLAGLALLLAAAPLLAAIGIAAAVANRGPALERVWCSGLQRIPFHLLRFRTRRPDGSVSRMGRVLARLHLANLPQLVNVVRGEMGLFGPAPVRKEFADRLCQALPAYRYRFGVKPGILGWSQANLRGIRLPDDALSLGYDLYYVKHQSPAFDLEILLRALFRAPGPAGGAAETGGDAAVPGGAAVVPGGGAAEVGGAAAEAGRGAVVPGGGAVVPGGDAAEAGGGAAVLGGGAAEAGGVAVVPGGGAAEAGEDAAEAAGGAAEAGRGAVVTGRGAVATGGGAVAAGRGAVVPGGGAAAPGGGAAEAGEDAAAGGGRPMGSA